MIGIVKREKNWQVIGVENRRREGVVDEMRDRPGEEVGEVSRDERNVRRGRTIRGMASRKVFIEDCKLAAFNGTDKRLTARITQTRIPSTVMGVEIPHDDGISSHVIQERLEIS